MLQDLKHSFSENPKKLFLIDGFGALLSSFLLGVVLVQLESIFGIPRNTLYLLATFPIFFAIYDFYCFKQIKKNISTYLKLIAYANLSYCCLSIALGIYHHELISIFGWIYIALEILIVVVLVYLELATANSLTAKK